MRSIRCVGLIGNPVRIGNGPAAVIGDELCDIPLPGCEAGREGADSREIRESEDLPYQYATALRAIELVAI